MTIQHTPVYGIAYADTATALSALADVTSQAASTIEAALARENITPSQTITDLINAGWFTDTGWLPITVNAGFAGGTGVDAPQVRKRAGVLIFQGQVLPTGMVANGSYGWGQLPAQAMPSVFGGAQLVGSSGAASAGGLVNAAGNITIRTNGTLGSYYRLDALSGVLAA